MAAPAAIVNLQASRDSSVVELRSMLRIVRKAKEERMAEIQKLQEAANQLRGLVLYAEERDKKIQAELARASETAVQLANQKRRLERKRITKHLQSSQAVGSAGAEEAAVAAAAAGSASSSSSKGLSLMTEE